ncbi:Transcriptional repressor IclR [subsurface metagenome]
MLEDKNLNKSLLRTISIVKRFTPDDPELSVATIAQKTEIPRTTVHRILATLTKGRLLEQNPKTSKYRIGSEFYVLGNLYLNAIDIPKAAEPVIKALNDLTGEVTNVGILDDNGYITVVLKEESQHILRVGIPVGLAFPAYAHALGKALLSGLTDAEVDNLYREETLRAFTKKTVATKTQLKRELQQVRETGVAFNLEQAADGAEAVASVIRDSSGKAVAAMAIAAPTARMNEAKRKKNATLVKLGASLASYRLGYQDMVNPVRNIEEILAWWEQSQADTVPYLSSGEE